MNEYIIAIFWQAKYEIPWCSLCQSGLIVIVRVHSLTRASEQLYIKGHFELFRVIVNYDGALMWSPGGSFKSQCAIDVQRFPFDVQRCTWQFINWMYTNTEIYLTVNELAETTLEMCCHNGEWDVSDRPAKATEKTLEGYTLRTIQFELEFKRKSMYYVINVVVPTLCLSLLVLLVLRLPAESGEKISMGVTLLLSFAVYMLLVSDSVPVTSDSVPVIGKWTTVAFCDNYRPERNKNYRNASYITSVILTWAPHCGPSVALVLHVLR